MKKLSIEEKAKAYDEAISIARKTHATQPMYREWLEKMFPELKESEDEKVRKALIEYFNEQCDMSDWNGVYGYQVVAWLEKQVEQKPFDYENANIQQKDFAPGTVGYEEERLTPLERKVKDFLFDFHVNAADGISFDSTMAIVHNLITLCQQEKKPQRMISAEAKEAMYSKPAWSEEDEERLQSCLNILQAKGIMGVTETINTKWLKSLKDRVQTQQEWSEEDIRNIEDIDSVLFYDKDLPEDTCVRLRNWLKSLRPQNKYDYNPYKAVVESIAEMCKHYDKISHSGLRDFYDNVKVKCKDAIEYDTISKI